MASYFKLDRLFYKIIKALEGNARMTNVELAETVSLSSSACLERVRRLEQEGVIAGYRSVVNLDRIGPNVMVFAEVTLGNHQPDDFRTFERSLADIPEIVGAYKISGPYDYTLIILCPDIRTYHAFSESLINSGIGIAKFIGHVVLDHTKDFEGPSIDAVIDPM